MATVTKVTMLKKGVYNVLRQPLAAMQMEYLVVNSVLY